MPNQFAVAGANPGKQTKFAPLYNGRWSTGIWTNRSPLRDANTTRQVEKFYGPSGDALIAGSNVEITNRLTLARRPGNGGFTNQIFSNIDSFYSFRLFDYKSEHILTMIDQVNALYAYDAIQDTKTLVWTKSPGAGQSYMQSVGNTLFFGNGVDNKKWLQTLITWQPNMQWNTTTGLYPFLSTFIIDPNGYIQQLTGASIPVTSVYANGTGAIQVFSNFNVGGVVQPGQEITFPTGMTASFLNGVTVTVLNVSTPGVTNPGWFTAYFNTPAYPNTMEANTIYAMVYPGDGTPYSGTTQPQWSFTVPSQSNNFQGGLTFDGTAVWTNRGLPVENWGIQPPTGPVPYTVHTEVGVYENNTFYSVPGVIVDTNGSIQQVADAGLSGGTEPTNWSTTVGGLTYENGTSGITWEMIQGASSLSWQPSTNYTSAAPFLVESASSTECLFELGVSTAPYITGNVTAAIFPGNPSEYGVFVQSYPTSLGSAQAVTTTLTGFNFTGNPLSSGAALLWDTLAPGTGQTVGYTNPFPAFTQDYDMVIMATLEVPFAGQYTFVNVHHDGCIWGIGGGVVVISATRNNPTGQTLTAVGGYPIIGGTNQRFEGGINVTDTFVLDFATAGTYPVEFNFAYWYHSGLQMTVTCNGNVIASGCSY